MTVIITSSTPVGTVITGFLRDLEAHQLMATNVQFSVVPVAKPFEPELFQLRTIESGEEIVEVGGGFDQDHFVPREEAARITFDYWCTRPGTEALEALDRSMEVVSAVQDILGANPSRGDLVDLFQMQTWTVTPFVGDRGVIFHLEFVLSVTTSLRS